MKWMMTIVMLALFALTVPGCEKHGQDEKEEHEHQEGKDHDKKGTDKKRHDDHDGEQHKNRKEGDKDHQDEELVTISPKAIKVLGIKTVRVEQRRSRNALRLTGQIEFNQNTLVHLSPRVSGRVIKVHKLLGEDVTKGEVLAELDSVALGKLKLKFLEARTELKLATTTLQREQRLRKAKITSEREFLLAKSKHVRARMRLNSSHDMLHLLGLSDKEIRGIRYGAHQTSRILLRAPISGRIIRKRLALGEQIKPGDKAYTVADLKVVWAQVDITEGEVAKIRRGMRARVFARSYPGHWFSGQITLISSSADAQTRTLRGRIVVKNRPLGTRQFPLRNKMYIEAEVFLAKKGIGPIRLVVPEVAVQRYKAGYIVFIEKKPGKYEPRPVILGERFAGRIAILKGIHPDETVVTQGAFSLKSEHAKNELGGGHSH